MCHRKTRYVNQYKTHLLSAVNPSAASSNRILYFWPLLNFQKQHLSKQHSCDIQFADVACAVKTQTVIEELLSSAVLACQLAVGVQHLISRDAAAGGKFEIGRASCRERVC